MAGLDEWYTQTSANVSLYLRYAIFFSRHINLLSHSSHSLVAQCGDIRGVCISSVALYFGRPLWKSVYQPRPMGTSSCTKVHRLYASTLALLALYSLASAICTSFGCTVVQL
jgi:hypothetical protein